jgi:outer membrane protein assembly factor BamB
MKRMKYLHVVVLAVLSVSSFAGWPGYRGPQASGSITSGEYPTKFDSKTAQWKVALPGKGTSVAIVHNETVFLTSPSDGQDAVLAFDFSGKKLWETKLGPESKPKHKQLASSCNASPVTDGKAIFVHFRSGNFAALEMDGKVRWKTNLVEQFGAEKLFWDTGTSPMLSDKQVVMQRLHGGDSWIAGFDKQTGEVRWKEERYFQAPNENDNGYTTPVLFKNAGKNALLVYGNDTLTAHDAENGKQIWKAGGFNAEQTGFWPQIASPVIAGDFAVVAIGRDDRGQGKIAGIKLGGKGDVSESHRAWIRSDIGVFCASPIEYKGRVYLLRHKGEIVCLDPANGKTIWSANLPEHRTAYYASPVIANGILYAAREDGVIFTGRVGDRFELLGENPTGERIVASPTPAADRLFVRGDNNLFCFAKN